MNIAAVRQFMQKNKRDIVAAGVVMVFAIAGLILITASRAAGHSAAREAESGVVAGNAGPGTTAGASGGASVKFGVGTTNPGAATLPLKVSANGRYLVGSNNAPFFYLADTGYSMFSKLSAQEMAEYMTTRRDQGFTVITASIHYIQGGTPHGTPISGSVSNINEQFFQQQVDTTIAKAKELGLVLALHPVWADDGGKLMDVVNEGNAQAYGQFLGNRYKNENHIIWILGGDHPGIETQVWRNMAKGLAIGQTGSEDYSKQIMTYHPRGDQTAHTWFRNDVWLDFIGIQSGHCPSTPLPWDMVADDYSRTPVKPVIDLEPIYEKHPYCWERPPDGYAGPLEARKMAYWNVFSGGFGHVYGHHSVWPFVTDRHPFDSWGGGVEGTWRPSLQAEGARHMVHVRKLMESRPFLNRIPDDSIITSSLGDQMERKVATRADDGSYLMVYTPGGGFSVNLNKLSGTTVRAYWYDTRTGTATDVNVTKGASVSLTPPGNGDYVFVADDASKNFARPGQ